MGIVDVAGCVRLAGNEIILGSSVPLARRYVKDGCWQIARLDRGPLAALLAYACDPRGLDPDVCAEAIREAAGLIGRDDAGVSARLTALPLRPAVSKQDMQLAHRLVQTGVPRTQLAAEVRRAKLGLGEAPPFSKRLALCGRGVVLGRGTVIAPLVELPGDRFGLKVEGREAEILALLSAARGGLAPVHVIERLSSVSRALQRGDWALAEVGLALVGEPALSDRAAADALVKAADALRAGVDPRELMKALGTAACGKSESKRYETPGMAEGRPGRTRRAIPSQNAGR